MNMVIKLTLTLTSILRMLGNFDFLDLLPKGGTISNTVFTSNVNLSRTIDLSTNTRRIISVSGERLDK